MIENLVMRFTNAQDGRRMVIVENFPGEGAEMTIEQLSRMISQLNEGLSLALRK